MFLFNIERHEKYTEQGLHSLRRSLKVWEKWDKLFKALKVCENLMGSVKVCEFVVFRALGKNYQLLSQKLHFSRPNSCLKIEGKKMLCKITKNALPISFD